MTDDVSANSLSLEAAKEKYRVEREKRLRPEGNAQYHDLTGRYAEFDHDPYSPPFARDPIVEDTDVVIVGGGFGGMLAAVNLTKPGISDFRIVEKAGDFGGTWYWNRYPGCMCDVESYVYLPMLEETGYMPTEKYAERHRDLRVLPAARPHVRPLPRRAVPDRDRPAGVGRRRSSAGRSPPTAATGSSAKFVVIAGGMLHKAKLPGIPGIETFAGQEASTPAAGTTPTPAAARSSPWTSSADKRRRHRSAPAPPPCRSVPAARASRPRSSTSSSARRPRSACATSGPTDVEWFKSLEPGWQDERIVNFTQAVTGAQPEVDLVSDGWTEHVWVDTKKSPSPTREAPSSSASDFETMEAIRRRVDEIVEDPETAEKLKPWYGKHCKRVCFHDEYLPAFNRPNVHLVDTDGRGVERITEHAAWWSTASSTRSTARLRVGLRGHHRLRPPARLRPQGPRRRVAERVVGRGPAHAARRPLPRLPEPA